jgi:hypothetical protein
MFKFTGGYSIILNLWITKVVAELSQTHMAKGQNYQPPKNIPRLLF